jgi:Protein of unknown function (DUF2971)
MIYGVTDSEKYVYHYTSAEVAADFILKSGTLKLGRYIGTNDPKEYRDWNFSIGTNSSRDLRKYSMDSLSRWLSNELKRTAKLACFATDTGPLKGGFVDLDIYKRGFSKPRMWAQYGNRHQGVCLVFDRALLDQRIRETSPAKAQVIAGKVIYADAPLLPTFGAPNPHQINVDVLEDLGAEAYVALHLKTYGHHMFFEKSQDWRDEGEFRWVVFTTADSDLFVEFDDALVGIMFGDSTSEKTVQDIMDMTEKLKLTYMGLKWRNSAPSFDMANLRFVPGVKGTPWEKQIKRV